MTIQEITTERNNAQEKIEIIIAELIEKVKPAKIDIDFKIESGPIKDHIVLFQIKLGY